MKVINQSEGDRIRYEVVDDEGCVLYGTGGRIGFIKTDPDRIVEERAEAWLAGYKVGLAVAEADVVNAQDTAEIYLAGMNSACEQRDAIREQLTITRDNASALIANLQEELNALERERDQWKVEAERWRMVADNAASDHAQADTDSLRALQERNELRKRVEELEARLNRELVSKWKY